MHGIGKIRAKQAAEAIRILRKCHTVDAILKEKGLDWELVGRAYTIINRAKRLGLVYHNKPRWYLLADWRESLERGGYTNILEHLKK